LEFVFEEKKDVFFVLMMSNFLVWRSVSSWTAKRTGCQLLLINLRKSARKRRFF